MAQHSVADREYGSKEFNNSTSEVACPLDLPAAASTVAIHRMNAPKCLKTGVNNVPLDVHPNEWSIHDLQQRIRREVLKPDLGNPSIPGSRMPVDGRHKMDGAVRERTKLHVREC